jgi:ribokinase
MDTVLAAAQAGHDAGATVLLNLSPYAEIPSALAGLTDVLLVNAHEAALFLGSSVPGAGAAASEWDAVRSRFSERGIHQVLVTLGAKGSVVLDSLTPAGSRVTFVQPTTVHAVDTTGAGDAFTGALAVRLAAGDGLADAAAFASVAAALATTRKGTQAAYPEAADVERRLRTP